MLFATNVRLPLLKYMSSNKYLLPAGAMDTRALDWLRMPLAICVIFIHSFGARRLNAALVFADPWSWGAIYDVVRVTFSKAFPAFAVPTFFMISGYLFFCKLETWNWNTYKEKLLRRVHTLLVPYIGWNVFHAIHLSWPTIMQIIRGEAAWDKLWRLLDALGGWRMFWDGHMSDLGAVNILGLSTPFNAPVLAPLWFLRDLMVLVIFAPVLYWLLKKFGSWVLLFVGCCFALNVWIPLHGFSASATFWFMLGAYFTLNRLNMVEEMYKRRWLAYGLSAVLLVLLVSAWTHITGSHSPAMKLLSNMYVCASVVGVVGFAGSLQYRGKMRLAPWLAKSSFFVYCAHIFFRKQVINLTFHYVPRGYLYQFGYYFFVPFATAFVCIVVRQVFIWGTRKLKRTA